MESVEAQGTTVAEATAAALAELDATIDDVDVDVLREPRRGLFGQRGKAIVRVTRHGGREDASRDERPAASLPDREEAERDGVSSQAPVASTPAMGVGPSVLRNDKETDMTETDVGSDAVVQDQPDFDQLSAEQRVELLDQECDIAADFVEGLLDLLDLPGDIEIEVEEDGAVVNVSEVGSGLLIGRRGATLDALQELVRATTQRQTERRSHVRVDVEGYRARQLEKLRSKCRDAIAQVRESGEPCKLEPMGAYERKMMHDLVARTGGVTSSSEGAEPKRRVVILPT